MRHTSYTTSYTVTVSALLFLLLWAPGQTSAQTAPAPAPATSPAREEVFNLLMMDQPVGQLREQDLTVTEQNEQRSAARVTMNMTINRMGVSVSVGMKHYEVYRPDGHLAHFRTELDMSQMPQIITGQVVGDECVINDNGRVQRVKWDPQAISEKQMDDDFKTMLKQGIGARVARKVFIPDMMKTVPTTTTLTALETHQTSFGPKKLYNFAIVMNVGTLVTSHTWVDGAGEVYEQDTALGPFTLQAIRVAGNAPPPALASDLSPDIFDQTILHPNRDLPNSLHIRNAVYRLHFNAGAAAKFYQGDDQKIIATQPGSVDLQITSAVPQAPIALSAVVAPPNGAMYLQPSALVQCDDSEIQSVARQQMQGETGAWHLAKKLEKWVNTDLTEKDLTIAFASAKETLERREGDCSEHATLLVALLRAAGLPARAAVGVIYADSIDGFGYHMWTQVYLNGRWYNLDATRPGGYVDATHIQMGDSALDQGTGVDLSTQILQYLGQFSVDVVKTSY